MIGVWRGRQIEELLAQRVNEALVDNLHQIWKDGQKAGQRDQFVNLARLGKNADPVLHEAARLIPNQTRDSSRTCSVRMRSGLGGIC